MKPRGLIRLSLILLVGALVPTQLVFQPLCRAHNLGGGLVGQQLEISVEQGTIHLDYTIEIPSSIWIREFRSDPRKDRTEPLGADAEFSSRLMERLHRGLILLWNRKEIPLVRIEGALEKSGFKDYNFFQYRLTFQGTFPEDEAGKIVLINRNYAGFQNVYSVSLLISPAYRLLETNLQEPGQRFLVDAKTGLPWSLWEGLRSLQIQIRPTPLWRSLMGGEGMPVRIDLKSVYGKTSSEKEQTERSLALEDGAPGGSAAGRIKAMLMQEDPDAGILMVALLLAFLLGAIHALSPGHGKALVGAYLVGTRGRPTDAVTLGLVVTASHVSSVLLLGVASLAASRYFVPEKMFPYIEMASALLLMGLGLWMLKTRWPGSHSGEANSSHTHQHPHSHTHTHPGHHEHHHPPPSPGKNVAAAGDVRWKEMLSLGISGGMVPCPSALAILLIAIALQKIAFGICIIIAFSLGLASVLVAVGLLLVWTRSFLGPAGRERAWLAWLPVASSVVVFLVGLFMFGRALLMQGTFA